MSLLNRIAISNKNIKRKEEANRQITKRDQAIVATWHQQLEAEIAAKMVWQQPGKHRNR